MDCQKYRRDPILFLPPDLNPFSNGDGLDPLLRARGNQAVQPAIRTSRLDSV
jgi:hypothetical protein